MAGFSDLPLDLLPYILDYLSKSEYNSLVRVCRSLHKAVIPYLFRHITFKANRSRACARQLAQLLRTLLDQPQLASRVESFSLFGPHTCWSKYNPWPESTEPFTANLWGLEGCTTLSKAQMIFASNQFYQLVDHEMHKSLAQFRGRSKDALATLVLTRFTNLTSLELGDGFLMYSLFLPQIMQRAPRLFPQLTHIVLGDRVPDPMNTIAYMDLDLIRPVFYIPTIQTFEWRMTQPWQFDWKQASAPWNESITTLHLFRANISRALLAEFLSAVPNLKRFCYQHEVPFQDSIPNRVPLAMFTNLPGLNHALSRVQDTLEEVELRMKVDPRPLTMQQVQDRAVDFPPIQGTLSILKHMRNLRNIDIPMVTILGWFPAFATRLHEVVPASVEDLTLSDDLLSLCPWVTGFDCFKKSGFNLGIR